MVVLGCDERYVDAIPLTTNERRSADLTAVTIYDYRDADSESPSIALVHRRSDVDRLDVVEIRNPLSQRDEKALRERLLAMENAS